MLLPTPQELKNQFPAPKHFIEQNRETARKIARGEDPRLLLIVGPCSIHDDNSSIEYAQKLKELSQEVSEVCFIMMRAFFEKPRTARGWTGMLYDPDLDGSGDIRKGIFLTRKLLHQFAEMEVPVCTEFLDPIIAPYFSDLISWGIIGARTAASPLHRQLVSSLSIPCGFKNGLNGNWQQAIHGIVTAKESFSRLTICESGRICKELTKGNEDGYLVLRGSCEKSNYDRSSIESALKDLRLSDLPERLMIDCSHGNSGKVAEKQIDVFRSVIEMRENGMGQIFGVLLESFLKRGKQPIENGKNHLKYGISITDSCLDWETTKTLILETAFTAHTSSSSTGIG